MTHTHARTRHHVPKPHPNVPSHYLNGNSNSTLQIVSAHLNGTPQDTVSLNGNAGLGQNPTYSPYTNAGSQAQAQCHCQNHPPQQQNGFFGALGQVAGHAWQACRDGALGLAEEFLDGSGKKLAKLGNGAFNFINLPGQIQQFATGMGDNLHGLWTGDKELAEQGGRESGIGLLAAGASVAGLVSALGGATASAISGALAPVLLGGSMALEGIERVRESWHDRTQDANTGSGIIMTAVGATMVAGMALGGVVAAPALAAIGVGTLALVTLAENTQLGQTVLSGVGNGAHEVWDSITGAFSDTRSRAHQYATSPGPVPYGAHRPAAAWY